MYKSWKNEVLASLHTVPSNGTYILLDSLRPHPAANPFWAVWTRRCSVWEDTTDSVQSSLLSGSRGPSSGLYHAGGRYVRVHVQLWGHVTSHAHDVCCTHYGLLHTCHTHKYTHLTVFYSSVSDHLAVTMLTPDRGSAGEGLKYQSRQKETLEHAFTCKYRRHTTMICKGHLTTQWMMRDVSLIKLSNVKETHAALYFFALIVCRVYKCS